MVYYKVTVVSTHEYRRTVSFMKSQEISMSDAFMPASKLQKKTSGRDLTRVTN